MPPFDVVERIVADLASRANPSKQEWWERYLKGVIPFLGVPMAQVREVVRAAAADLDDVEVRRVGLQLLEGEIAEQKLAGILAFAEFVEPSRVHQHLGDLSAVFEAGHVWDWNTCDWLCVKVLGRMVADVGRPAAESVAAWKVGENLWQRRASMVGFVPVAPGGDSPFDGLVDLVLDVCAHHLGDEERFIQTGIGWTLRELSSADPGRVGAFVLGNQEGLSREAVRMAVARLPDDIRRSVGVTGQRRRR